MVTPVMSAGTKTHTLMMSRSRRDTITEEHVFSDALTNDDIGKWIVPQELETTEASDWRERIWPYVNATGIDAAAAPAEGRPSYVAITLVSDKSLYDIAQDVRHSPWVGREDTIVSDSRFLVGERYLVWLTRAPGLPPTLGPLSLRLKELMSLDEDWDGFGGLPTTRTAAAMTKKILYELVRAMRSANVEPSLAPLADGGIDMEWVSAGGDELLVEVPAAGRPLNFVLSPNPPKDTDGRREDSGRGWVRELQGRWPGVLG